MNLNKIAVIGAGTMGSGIAQWFAQQKVQVALVDQSLDAVNHSLEQIKQSWSKLQAKGKFTDKEIKSFSESIKAVLIEDISPDTELVIEAVFEDLEVKNNIFKQLDSQLNETCIFASNTSSFPMITMAKELSEKRRSRFLGLHFFNPATIMKLVEVISSIWTEPQVVEQIYQWFDAKGKKPAKCSDSPGFICNRVARNFYGEALRVVENYYPEKIKETDTILREVGGFRMGPFELMDLIGIDINYQVTQSVWEAYFHEERFKPHALQRQMVQAGTLGRKTGRGFYEHS